MAWEQQSRHIHYRATRNYESGSRDLPMHGMGITPLVSIPQSYRESDTRPNVSASTPTVSSSLETQNKEQTQQKSANLQAGS